MTLTDTMLHLMCPDGVGLDLRSETFQLPAGSASVRTARTRTRGQLSDWGGLDESAFDIAVLVMSELFTNAVVHTDSGVIDCFLGVDHERLYVAVADRGESPTGPRTRLAGIRDESGRGLLIVGRLTKEWGVGPGEDGMGRVVWAALRISAA